MAEYFCEHNLCHGKLLPKSKWRVYFMSNIFQPRKLIKVRLYLEEVEFCHFGFKYKYLSRGHFLSFKYFLFDKNRSSGSNDIAF